MSILSKLFSRRSKPLTGIDIGSGFIKVAEIDYTTTQPTLVAAGLALLPQGVIRDGTIINATLLASQLQQLLLSAGCRSRDVVFSVGGRSTFVREVLFPVMEPDELKEAITWDIDRYVPYAPDTYYYDYAILNNTATGLEMRVLVTAAPKEVVDALVAVAKAAGLSPVAVDTDAFAAGRVLGNPDSALLVDIGDAITQITVFQSGCPVATRVAAIGGRNFTAAIMSVLGLTYQEAELLKVRQDGLLGPASAAESTAVSDKLAAAVKELSREIVQTAEYYKIQNPAAVIDKVVLTGGGANLANLTKHLESLAGMPVSLLNPLFSIHSAVAFDPQYLRSIAGQLTVAVGLSMRGGDA